jgi:hypothetical protein
MLLLPCFCSRTAHPSHNCGSDRTRIASSTSAPRSRSTARASERSASTRNASRTACFPLGAGAAQAGRAPPAARATAAPPIQAGVLPVSAPPHPAAPQLRSVPLSLSLIHREIGANCLASATSGMSGATAHLRRAPRRLFQRLRRTRVLAKARRSKACRAVLPRLRAVERPPSWRHRFCRPVR